MMKFSSLNLHHFNPALPDVEFQSASINSGKSKDDYFFCIKTLLQTQA